MLSSVWVFGYGSLANRASLAQTVSRAAHPGVELSATVLHGWGRRWNAGSAGHRLFNHHLADGTVFAGVVVYLGLVASAAESINGVAIEVDREELASLDRREGNYDRVEITDHVEWTVGAHRAAAASRRTVYTYVPTSAATARASSAARDGNGAVRAEYVSLVEAGFAELGQDQLHRYRVTTPSPDVPVVPLERRRASSP